MNYMGQDIALRLRGLREASGLTPDEVATRTGVTPEQYSAYEQNAADIPVGYLSRLAAFHRVDVANLLTGGEAHARMFCVTRKGCGPEVGRRAQYQYESLAAGFAGKTMEPYLVEVGPRDDETIALNTHAGQEFNHVLEGRLQVRIAGHDVVLEPGDSLFFDASKPHGMRALEGRRARFLAIMTH